MIVRYREDGTLVVSGSIHHDQLAELQRKQAKKAAEPKVEAPEVEAPAVVEAPAEPVAPAPSRSRTSKA